MPTFTTDLISHHQWKPKFTQLKTLWSIPNIVKFIILKLSAPRQQKGQYIWLQLVYFVVFVTCNQTQRKWLGRLRRCIRKTTRFHARGHKTLQLFYWVTPQKNSLCPPRIWISSLNVRAFNFKQRDQFGSSVATLMELGYLRWKRHRFAFRRFLSTKNTPQRIPSHSTTFQWHN